VRGVYFFATALLNMAFAFVTDVIGWVYGNFNFIFAVSVSFYVFSSLSCEFLICIDWLKLLE